MTKITAKEAKENFERYVSSYPKELLEDIYNYINCYSKLGSRDYKIYLNDIIEEKGVNEIKGNLEKEGFVVDISFCEFEFEKRKTLSVKWVR